MVPLAGAMSSAPLCVVRDPLHVCQVLPGEPGRISKQSEKELDFYHRVHPTWVCTQALRDRDFKIGANAFWPEFIQKVLKETSFTTLAYKPGW